MLEPIIGSQGKRSEMAIEKCWYERTCRRKGDICDNLKNCENCTRYLQMKLQTEMANIPGELPIDLRLDETKEDLEAYIKMKNMDMQEFVVQGKSLVIESETFGCGKTSWAKKLLLRYMVKKVGRINTGYFMELPIVLPEIKEAIRTKEELPYKKIFQTVRLLVIDEVGFRKLTEYEESWLLRMLAEREKVHGATIYTMNTSKDLREFLGKRLYSRIYNKSQHIVLREGDKRSWGNKD